MGERLTHAQVLQKRTADASQVFWKRCLGTNPSFSQATEGQPSGPVICSVPFLSHRRPLVAVGCEAGVWVGNRHQPLSFRQVLRLPSVTQISVLEDELIMLVLSQQKLFVFNLEAVVGPMPPLHVSSRSYSFRNISSFGLGQFDGRALLVVMEYKVRLGIGETVFRVFDARRLVPLFSVASKGGTWNKKLRPSEEFYVPGRALGVQFLQSGILVLVEKVGFEFMVLTTKRGVQLPTHPEGFPELDELAKSRQGATPLGMVRSSATEFLLCYDTYGVHVNNLGHPTRTPQAIQWEGVFESVAFHPPYALLLSPSVIEVRHITTAKLLHIYVGHDIRCTWDGTGTNRPPDVCGPRGWGDMALSLEPRVHITESPNSESRWDASLEQSLFELIPLDMRDQLTVSSGPSAATHTRIV